MQTARHEEGDAPCSERSGVEFFSDQVVDERHNELRSAAAHITPPSSGAVGEADDLAVEHGAHSVLARHEGGEGESDEKADGDESSGR